MVSVPNHHLAFVPLINSDVLNETWGSFPQTLGLVWNPPPLRPHGLSARCRATLTWHRSHRGCEGVGCRWKGTFESSVHEVGQSRPSSTCRVLWGQRAEVGEQSEALSAPAQTGLAAAGVVQQRIRETKPESHIRAVIAPGLMISSPVAQLFSIPVLPSVISILRKPNVLL